MKIVGVRHHSPACARLVDSVLRREKPACVLIEGPSDFNARLDELHLVHRLPLALFSFKRGQGGSWTPFCDYSPEWVALKTGKELGAEVRFMDLPAWHEAMHERLNRYSDRRAPSEYELAERLGFDDPDSLWDHLFEHPGEDLEGRLQRFFRTIREDVLPQDEVRERFMARCLGWARHTYGESVVAVCGGFHAPFLEGGGDGQEWPTLADEPEAGSYLVPFSFKRLDSFAGYASGMPSPGYYQRVWDAGLREASQGALQHAARRLRDKKLPISSADLIAANTLTEGLARLRGHQVPLRTDLLDGLVGALVKEALQARLPWSRRGPLSPDTDPVLVELVAAFSGERQGALAPGTPRPPLVADVRAQLDALGLLPSSPARQVTVPAGSPACYCLRRLELLSLPGFRRLREAPLEEDWALQETLELESALVEASLYGSDLESAAAAVLEEGLALALDSASLATLLALSVRAGLPRLSQVARERVRQALDQETDLGRLGAAITQLFGLYRQNLGAFGLPTAFARGLWLLEGLEGANRQVLQAIVALRDLHKLAPDLELARELAEGVVRRRLQEAPVELRGAALGYLWSLELGPGEDEASQAVRTIAPPEQLGDFLAGLFALAREEVQRAEGLLTLLDSLLGGLDPKDFLRALPGLRLAFGFFPPRERQQVAAVIARLHGRESTFEVLHSAADPELVARAMQLELEVEELVERYGL